MIKYFTIHSVAFIILFILPISVYPQNENVQQIPPMKDGLRENYTQADYENLLLKEKLGEIPFQGGIVDQGAATDALVNNNAGATGTGYFTQSETDIVAFGSNVLIGFNDSGSNNGGGHFTGFSYSTDGGLTFTDGGTLPASANADYGDPAIGRNEITGRIYFSTLGSSTIQVFRSDNNGINWMAPINGTPGGSSEDKQWLAVDNFGGTGNGNVYLISRRFGSPAGIYMFRSTDQGDTFGPSGGVSIFSGGQGAYVSVGSDHSVYAFYYNGSTSIMVRKSTDYGVTFGTAVTVVSGLNGGSNGDLGLTGLRQGTATYSSFRSNSFPHASVNPISGHIYVTFNDDPTGTDKGDVYMVMSTNGGATWSARTRVNDDATTTDQWQPTIAVTPDGNNIGIFYYSRQEDVTNNNLFKYYGRLGTISGSTVTFSNSFAISDIASLPEFGRDNVVNSTYMGDYNHASATTNEFHLVWSDNRNDLSGGAGRKDPNCYYEKIIIGPPCLVGPPTNPSPTNELIDVPISLSQISWSNGANAVTNELYFGTDPFSLSLVQSGNLATSWTIPGGLLDYSTTYYWRVIEVGTCNANGPLWSFTTEVDPSLVTATVFFDNFESGLGQWTVTNNAGTCIWEIFTPPYPNSYTLPATSSGGLLAADSDECGNGTTLRSTATIVPILDLSAYTDAVWIEFDNDWRIFDSADEAHVEVSTNGGSSWIGVWDYIGTSVRNTHEVINVTSLLAGKSNVSIRVRTVQPGFDWWWVLDNFSVYGQYTMPAVTDPISLTASAVSYSQIDLSFTTNSSNNNVIVVWNQTGTFTDPSGIPPSIGQPFAGGTLLYNGIVSPVIHNGLNGSTTYYYKAFSNTGVTYSPGIISNATTLQITDFLVDLLISDNCNSSITLHFGTAPGATDCYDPGLDVEAPPPPPPGAFDGRFISCVTHLFTDIKATNLNAERLWDLDYQPSSGCSPVTLSWNPSELPVGGYFHLVDPVLGNLVNVNMRTTNTYTDQLGLGQLQIKYNYEINSKYNVIAGWNMLSLPVDVSNNNYQTLFPNALVGSLYGYSGTYFSTTTVNNNEGYWLKFPSSEVVDVYGTDNTESVIVLSAGWNLIGGPNCNVPLSNVIDPGVIIIPGTLYWYSGTYSTVSSIDGTKAYWIKANAGGTITINCSNPAVNNVNNIFSQESVSNFGIIEISDANETNQTLYFRGELDENINIESFSLPPLPPPGGFDARLSGDFRLSESDEVTIQIQSSNYPIRLKVTNLNTNESYVLIEVANGVEVNSRSITDGSEIVISNEDVSILKLTKQQSLPTTYNLEQNYPNPFNPSTTIKFSLPEATNVMLTIYNTLGQKVGELVNTNLEAGYYNYQWDATNMSTGIYIYELRTNKFVSVKKMILMK